MQVKRSIWLCLFLFLLSYLGQAQLTVQGKTLTDKNGDQIIVRGAENFFGKGLSEDGSFIDEIAKTGANAVRILPNLSDGQLTTTQVENLIVKAKNNGMIVFVTPYLATPATSDENEERFKWFERDDVYGMMQRHKDYVIIDAMGEQNYDDDNRFASSCENAINRMRARGYTQPLCLLSTFFGRNHNAVINKGAEIVGKDPLKNVFFGVQAYWDQNYENPKKYSTEIIKENLAALNKLNFLVQIGICPWAEGASCDNGYVDYKIAMSECQRYGFGWLVWDWSNQFDWTHSFSMTIDGIFGNWINHCAYAPVDDCRDNGKFGCDYGYQVAVGHEASIQKTAKKTCFLLGNCSRHSDSAIQAAKELNVYPNPSTGITTFSFEIPSKGRVRVELYDQMGRMVKEIYYGNRTVGSYRETIDVSRFGSGVYYLNLSIGDYKFSVKKIEVLK